MTANLIIISHMHINHITFVPNDECKRNKNKIVFVRKPDMEIWIFCLRWRSTMSHSILDDLIASLPDDRTPVRSVTVGAHWTAVCSRHCGLATTIIGEKPHDHATVVRDAGRLHLMTAQELARYARSDNLLEAGIGIAAINSLLDMDERDAVEINASELLMKRGEGKNVALVGHFPFIPRLRKSVKNPG